MASIEGRALREGLNGNRRCDGLHHDETPFSGVRIHANSQKENGI
jgi:hypothetical protein